MVDSGGFSPWGESISLPCPNCTAKWDDLVVLGASWRKDSSLEKWFPITAERLAKLESSHADLCAALEAAIAALDRLPKTPEEFAAVAASARNRTDGSYADNVAALLGGLRPTYALQDARAALAKARGEQV